MRIFLVIFFAILVLVAWFSLWVLASMAGMATRMEENMKKKDDKSDE